MKILQVFNKYVHEGGEEKSVDRIFEVLGKSHEVRQVSFDSSVWAQRRGLYHQIRQALAMIWNPRSVMKVRTALEEFRPDFVLIHNLFPVGSAALLRLLTQQHIPVVYYVHNFRPFSVNGYLWADDQIQPQGLNLNFFSEIYHGSWQDSRMKTGWYAGVLWMLHLAGVWKRLDHWIAISQFMKSSFEKAGIPGEKISVVRHSWQIQRARIERRRFNEMMPFLFLGRLNEQKGIPVLIEAWEKVSEQSPSARLVICGEGPLEDFVIKAAARLPGLEFRGFVSGRAKEELLENSRCLLAPSVWYEPLGLVVYDGYEYSLPVIAAASGGLAEIVEDGETGFLVEPGDAPSLSNAILRVIALLDGGLAIGKEGRCWLEENTTHDQWNSEILNVFEKLLATKSAS